MRVLITGAGGQVGRALLAAIPTTAEVRATTHSDLDICDPVRTNEYIASFKPQLIINAAAYTQVDRAESDQTSARRVNSDGPSNLASAAARLGDVRLLHISTDFVYDGHASTPYAPSSATNPLSVYGSTKLAGDQAVSGLLGEKVTIVRTAWVYASWGQNFLKTMLRLMNNLGAVRVVADQIGSPTSANSLAEVLWRFAARPDLSGIFNWTDAGVASWYDFATAIAEEATARGLLKCEVNITPISTAEYPTPAARPAFSVLDKSSTLAALDLRPVHWRSNLRRTLEELAVA